MTGPYDDMIHLPPHVSQTRPRMPLEDRAAQFSPFAALTGHGAAIRETARITDQRMELDEDAKAVLSAKLNALEDLAPEHPEIEITYFLSDGRKDGGAYVAAAGSLKKIDHLERSVILMEGIRVPIDEILEIESECLKALL